MNQGIRPLTSRLVIGLAGLAMCAGTVGAAGPAGPATDVGTKPPVAAPGAAALVDKSPRCVPEAVNRCRAACDTRKWDSTPKEQQPRKVYDCKQDCVRGC